MAHEAQQEKTTKWSNLNAFQKCPLWTHIDIGKIQHIDFWVHGYFSWSTFGLHLVKGRKFCKLISQEIGPWKLDHQVIPWKKCHASMLRLHGSWCKPTLEGM